MLSVIADDFVDKVINAGWNLAKHRGSDSLEVSDIQLFLNTNYNLAIPGFGHTFDTESLNLGIQPTKSKESSEKEGEAEVFSEDDDDLAEEGEGDYHQPFLFPFLSIPIFLIQKKIQILGETGAASSSKKKKNTMFAPLPRRGTVGVHKLRSDRVNKEMEKSQRKLATEKKKSQTKKEKGH